MSVQVKAYLYEERPCRTKEIRRFSIDHDVLSNYDYLRRKISSIFPNINDGFYLQWKDSEGDFITFNTDDELLQALGQHSENELKIYIKNSSRNCSSSRSGPRFGGQRYSPYQTPMDFISPEIFCSFPFFASCNEANKSSESQNQSSTSNPQCQSEFKGFDKDHLQQMGNAVAELLHPFGVDVDINVQKKEKEDSKEPAPQTSGATENPSTSSTKETPSTSNSSTWAIIDKEEKAANESKSSGQDKMEVDDDARLREAVDRLLGMGFNDHGGWLTNLMKASDCDIGRALDAMQPNRNRKNPN